MITKVLLTLLVLLIAYAYLKRRTLLTRADGRRVVDRSSVKAERSKKNDPIWTMAMLFLVVCFTLTLIFFGYRWYDDHQLLKITLISPRSSELLYYEVYKSELQERSFTTTTGQIIRLADQDRLQIEPLTD